MEAFNAFSVRLSGVAGGGGSVLPFCFPSRAKRVSGRHGHVPFLCCASPKDRPELDKWDMMELKFGRLLGEDPKLTLAKVKKNDPMTSFRIWMVSLALCVWLKKHRMFLVFS